MNKVTFLITYWEKSSPSSVKVVFKLDIPSERIFFDQREEN